MFLSCWVSLLGTVMKVCNTPNLREGLLQHHCQYLCSGMVGKSGGCLQFVNWLFGVLQDMEEWESDSLGSVILYFGVENIVKQSAPLCSFGEEGILFGGFEETTLFSVVRWLG